MISLKISRFLSSKSMEKMTTHQAINNALDIAMSSNDRSLVFGEDIAFGGVFRCTTNLQQRYGPGRVFNTPLSEQGIIGFGIGAAAMGWTAIAEIQFADYVYPAIDQIINEAAKYRYRSGGQFNVGGLTIRMPYGAVGHGGHYHSQSPETYFVHTAGLKVVIPRGPATAKGLLLSSIRDKNPVIFMEPKITYRLSAEYVPTDEYELPLGKGEVLRPGKDVTVVGYGSQLLVLEKAIDIIEEEMGVSCELIDLQTLLPWDVGLVESSVNKTGRLVVAHEAPRTLGFGAEVCSEISERCFLTLESPVIRVCGLDTPFPLTNEKYYVPGVERCVRAIKKSIEF